MSGFAATPSATVRWPVAFCDAAELSRAVEAELAQGGMLLAGATGLNRGDECVVVLVHPGDRSELAVEAVVAWVADEGGVGVVFRDFGPDLKRALVEFAAPRQPASRAARPERERTGQNVHERLRSLNPSEQLKVARSGEVNERVVLERLYGKAVWDALLRNPRLTVPEVARLARMGNLPRPQLETIVGNPAWINAPEVRRALLANRRLSGVMIHKVLRAMPKAELRLACKQTAYPPSVRDAAIKLLKR